MPRTAPTPASVEGTARRPRRPRVSQSLARRQARRLARLVERLNPPGRVATPDDLIAAVALYARGALGDLPPQRGEQLAQDVVAAVRGLTDRYLPLPTQTGGR